MAYTDYTSSSIYVNPTELDVNGGYSGYGRVLMETPLTYLIRGGLGGYGDHVIGGFTPPGNGVSVGGGYACSGLARIHGYFLGFTGTGTITVSFPYSTNWVYLGLQKAGAKVLLGKIQVFDAEQMPMPMSGISVPLWKVPVSGGITGTVVDLRRTGQVVWGALSRGASSWSIRTHGSGNWTISGAGSPYTVGFTFPFYRTPSWLQRLSELGATVDTLSTTGFQISGSISTGDVIHFAVTD